MAESHSQTAELRKKMLFTLLCLKVAKLNWISECLWRIQDCFEVQVTWSEIKVKLLVFEKMLSAQYL